MLCIVSPGGGGFGNPRDRDREKVQQDFENGKISAEAARDDYGHVVNVA
jgi:N-methylhydantoinase B